MKKKHYMKMFAVGAVALLLSMIPSGCTDREESPSTEKKIRFAVNFRKEETAAQIAQTKDTGATADSLSADIMPTVSVIALESEADEGGTPLYLHAVTTEGIGGTECIVGEGDGRNREAGGIDVCTKAAPVDNATMYDEMCVTAFVYPTAQSWPAAYGGVAELYMRTVKVKKSEAWNTSYDWPGDAHRISFFASAPYGSPGLTAFNDGASGTPPYLSYTVPSDVADQKDLLVATSTDRPGNSNATEPLTMKRVLTAVRFVTGDDMLAGKVSKITLKNVYGTGKLPLRALPAWYDLGGATNFEQTLSPEVVAPDPQAPDTPLTPEAATFMMLPQTLPTGAQIEVKYTDKLTNTQRSLTADISGKTWPMGKTVTYRISTSNIAVRSTLTVTPAMIEFNYNGKEWKTYTVTSYASVSEGESTANVPMAWEAEFSEDGGSTWNANPPAWLTAFTKEDNGGTSAASYDAKVDAQVISAISNPNNEALKNAPQVTDYDLSKHDYQGNTVPMRTANCYIVNAPGTYRLPLVYGNAIKNGATNSSAYISAASGSYVLTPFINHLGAGITNPYIYENAGCAPDNCMLIWQDEQNLVTDVAISSDKHYLEFKVGRNTIRQGNAVVAVRDASNTVLWSWHIWVTDYKPGTSGTSTPDKEITSYQGKKYKIMTVNLGWCDGKEETYAERTVQVRFRQKSTAGYTPEVTQMFTIKQKAHTGREFGNNTCYQWGRKDPFVGGIFYIEKEGNVNRWRSKNKTWYDANGNVKTNQLPPTSEFTVSDITSCVTNPNTFCTRLGMNNYYANLWSANNTDYDFYENEVVKTIYDPSPAGYKIPLNKAFTGFTTTGGQAHSSSQFNVSGAWNFEGWNFYCGLNKTGDTVFFPASGYRYYATAEPKDIRISGLYWMAVPKGIHSGGEFFFKSFYISILDGYIPSYGGSVRPCQE